MTWIDHHEWDKGIINELSRLGIKIIVERRDSCAELVANYFGIYNDSISMLLYLARDSDKGIHDSEITLMLDRLLLRVRGLGIRYKLLQDFIHGVVNEVEIRKLYAKIKQEYESVLVKAIRHMENNLRKYYINEEYMIVTEVIVEGVLISELKRILESKYPEAVLYVLAKPSEHRATIFSRKINVAILARELGGGGHEEIAGIPWSNHHFERILEEIKEMINKTR